MVVSVTDGARRYRVVWKSGPAALHIAGAATSAGRDVNEPSIFTVEGEFTDLRLHVINGACPVRARMKKETLSDQLKPFESEMSSVRGKIVGFFAKDAVCKLMHSATSTHCHLVFTDPVSGKRVTGHLEQVGVRQGAQVSVPEPLHSQWAMCVRDNRCALPSSLTCAFKSQPCGTTTLMPDTEANQRAYPQTWNQKADAGFPHARVATVFLLSCGVILDLGITKYAGKGQGEVSLLHKLSGVFSTGDVLLADALMCN